MAEPPAGVPDVTIAELAATLEDCPPLAHEPARATALAAALIAPVQERDAPAPLAPAPPIRSRQYGGPHR